MARNFSLSFGESGSWLRAQDLTVGQELVRVIYPYWSTQDTLPIETTTWTVTKILKTVVVIERNGVEKRIKVERSDYPSLAGRLTTDAQGDSYNYNTYNLLTTDDEKVTEIAEMNEYRATLSAALAAARSAWRASIAAKPAPAGLGRGGSLPD